MKVPDSIDALQETLDSLGVSLPLSNDTSVLGDDVALGRLTAPNRFVALPMEGCDAEQDGSPGELTFRRYERMAAGGAGIIWLEACAVQREGSSNPDGLVLHDGNVTRFRELVDRMRAAARKDMRQDIVCILQLTHAGRYSKPLGEPSPVVVRHCPELDAAQGLPGDYALVADASLDEIQEAYISAASLAHDAGFDGVDVKSCHGYLVSSLLAAHERAGKYGGSYENRSRFLKETIAGIMNRCPSLLVTTRMSAFDGMAYPYGFGVSRSDGGSADMQEPMLLAKELSQMGVPLLNVSMGYPRFDPHYGRPASDGKQEHPLVGISRFATATKEIQAGIPGTPTVVGALAWLGQHLPAVAAGLVKTGAAQLIGQGRGSIAYPELVRDVLGQGQMSRDKCCIACSGCSRLMRAGKHVGCVVRDRSIYSA